MSPTHWQSEHTCKGCGCTFTRHATTRERPDPPVPGEPLYGPDLERVTFCLECRLAQVKP